MFLVGLEGTGSLVGLFGDVLDFFAAGASFCTTLAFVMSVNALINVLAPADFLILSKARDKRGGSVYVLQGVVNGPCPKQPLPVFLGTEQGPSPPQIRNRNEGAENS